MTAFGGPHACLPHARWTSSFAHSSSPQADEGSSAGLHHGFISDVAHARSREQLWFGHASAWLRNDLSTFRFQQTRAATQMSHRLSAAAAAALFVSMFYACNRRVP